MARVVLAADRFAHREQIVADGELRAVGDGLLGDLAFADEDAVEAVAVAEGDGDCTDSVGFGRNPRMVARDPSVAVRKADVVRRHSADFQRQLRQHATALLLIAHIDPRNIDMNHRELQEMKNVDC